MEQLQKKLKITPELIPGRNGIFDVKLDGEMIFSKYEQNRFPEENEVLDLIKARIK